MQYEACSMCSILAEVRQSDLQSELERYWSVRRDVLPCPTMSDRLVAGAQRLVRALSPVRIPREGRHVSLQKLPRELVAP